MCNCKIANFGGSCSCGNSSFEGLESHLPKENLKSIKNNFEDNLFKKAFYAIDEEGEEFLGGRKRLDKNSSLEAKPKRDFKKTALQGAELFKSISSILEGSKTIKGDMEGTSYTIGLNPTESKEEQSSKEKKLMGMPKMVFYTVAGVMAIVVAFIIIKLVKK